VGLFLFLKVS